MACGLIHKGGDGVNLHALSAPPEGGIGRRVAATDEVGPDGLLGRGPQQVDFDVETALLREALYARQGAFDHFDNGGDLNPGVGAEDGDRLLALVLGDAGNDLDDERGEHGTVLAAAEADQPGEGILQIQVAEGVFNVTVAAGTHWREHRPRSGHFKSHFSYCVQQFGADDRA